MVLKMINRTPDSGLKQLPFNGLCTSVMCRSVPQMPEYATRTTTSCLFGSEGSGALMRESSLFLGSNCTASIVGSVNKKCKRYHMLKQHTVKVCGWSVGEVLYVLNVDSNSDEWSTSLTNTSINLCLSLLKLFCSVNLYPRVYVFSRWKQVIPLVSLEPNPGMLAQQLTVMSARMQNFIPEVYMVVLCPSL